MSFVPERAYAIVKMTPTSHDRISPMKEQLIIQAQQSEPYAIHLSFPFKYWDHTLIILDMRIGRRLEYEDEKFFCATSPHKLPRLP